MLKLYDSWTQLVVELCYDELTPRYIPIIFASYVYIVLPLSVIGIILNVASAVALERDETKRRTTRYPLQMLAIADCTFLVSALACDFTRIYVFTNWFTIDNEDRLFSATFSFMYIRPFYNVTLNAAVWMVAIVTAERYLAVCWPLLARRYITMRSVRLAVGINWFVSCVIGGVSFSRVEMKEKIDGLMTCRPTMSVNSPYYSPIYTLDSVSRCVTTFIVPLFVICFCNASLVRPFRVMNTAHKRRQAMHGRPSDDVTLAKREHRFTRTVVVVVMVFVMCQLPEFAYHVLHLSDSWPEALEYTYAVSMILLPVNSACNFLIYCFVGKRFRQILCGCSFT